MILDALADADLEALLAIQHATAGQAAPWSAEALRRTLYDRARGGGAQVRVARAGGEVLGACAWVDGGDLCFLSPLLARTAEAARALVEHGIGVAGATARIRVTAGARDSHVARTLEEMGFAFHSEFLELSRATAATAATAIAPLAWCALAGADPARLLALHNETFRGVPNTLPLEPADLDELLRDAYAEASSVIADGEHYAAHLFALRHAEPEPHAEIELIGVRDAYRRRGLGAAMIARALDVAHRAGLPEVRALVSSLNPASLELHRQCGFTVRYRRFQWQREPAAQIDIGDGGEPG